MDPEQGFLIVHKYFPVKCNVLIFCTFARVLSPQRVGIADRDRTFHNLDFLLRLALFAFLLLFFNMLYHFVCIQKVFLIDRLVFRLGICPGKEDLHRHERTVFLQHFSCSVLVGKLKAVLVQEQRDLRAYCRLVSFLHLILCTALACPMYRNRAFFIGKRIDLHLIRNHKRRVESKSEVADHIVLRGLVLIFLEKLCCSGKRDLCDVFFHFVRSHSKSVIDELHRLLFRIDNNFYLRFIPFWKLVLAHHIQLFQFRDRIASVGYHLTHKNIMV